MGNFRKYSRVRMQCTKCGRSYYKKGRQYYDEEHYRCKHCQELTLSIVGKNVQK
jgi:transposase-like protein